MIKIEIKNRFTGSIIFTYEKENATIKEAVLKALKEGANLYGANLRGANLENANLENANLENANLRGANLENANRVPMFCKWTHGTKGDLIQIGCKEKTIEDWDLFFASDETYETDRDTDDFKQIQAVYLAYKSYLTHLK
jgi:hypothetical protein